MEIPYPKLTITTVWSYHLPAPNSRGTPDCRTDGGGGVGRVLAPPPLFPPPCCCPPPPFRADPPTPRLPPTPPEGCWSAYVNGRGARHLWNTSQKDTGILNSTDYNYNPSSPGLTGPYYIDSELHCTALGLLLPVHTPSHNPSCLPTRKNERQRRCGGTVHSHSQLVRHGSRAVARL